MANNYILFAVEFSFPEQAAQDFIALCNDDFDAYPQWFIDKHRLTEDSRGEFEYNLGVTTEYSDNKLYIASEDHGDIDGVAYMLSEVMEHHNIREAIVIEAAFTCSKMRPYSFGGTVVVIGPGMYEFKGTYEFGQELIKEMGLEE